MTNQKTKSVDREDLWLEVSQSANNAQEGFSNNNEVETNSHLETEAEPEQEPAPAETSEPATTANTESTDSAPNPILAAAGSSMLQTIHTTAVAASEISSVDTSPERFIRELSVDLFINQYGAACSVQKDEDNHYALVLGSKMHDNLIREKAQSRGITLRKKDIFELNEILRARAEKLGKRMETWIRVAPFQNGIEIDMGDDKFTRVRVVAGKVEIITNGSETLFLRSKLSKPMVLPAAVGDLKLLNKYLNLNAISQLLFIAWISYTLAHPKVSTTKYLILLLLGSEGTSKSFITNQLILPLLDPNVVGLQMLPNNLKDLAIASQNAHVLAYDNIREIKPYMSDILCVAATGGAMSTRQLYSDADQQVIYLHGALVLNGIYSFVTQPDLAQRCLPLHLKAINEASRKSESVLVRELQNDLPAIQKGLYDLVANILTHLPSAQVTSPERMIDFVHWLAAMELVNGAPVGAYQSVYSDALNECRLDALQDSLLAAAVMNFAQSHLNKGSWIGSPSELLIDLNKHADAGSQRSRDWPQNAIALSKRLIPLQASLLAQGISIELSRGKNRTIKINVKGDM